VLANILLHGIDGEITVAGAKLQGRHAGLPQLGDAELAAVASYIRSAWGNKAGAVASPSCLRTERKASGRSTPFEGGAALKALAKPG
jgi:mono/diheme cytochrome c family protein